MNLKLLGLLSVLILAALACRFFPAPVQRPVETIAVSTEAAGALEVDVRTAAEQASATGVVELQLTEEQVTSYVALHLQEQQEFVLLNPQIYLRDGKVLFFGDLQQDTASLALYAEAEPKIEAGGQPRLTIVRVQLGYLTAPEVMVTQVQQFIDQAYASFVGSAGSNFVAESITIANGVLTIKGTVK